MWVYFHPHADVRKIFGRSKQLRLRFYKYPDSQCTDFAQTYDSPNSKLKVCSMFCVNFLGLLFVKYDLVDLRWSGMISGTATEIDLRVCL